MTEFVVVLLSCVAVLAASTVIVLVRAREAEQSGELRLRTNGVWGEQVIRRDDDPRRFAIELKFLRAVPWFAFALISMAALMIGAFL